MPPTPPSAPRRPHAVVAHGDERVDDWYWLRDRDDPEVLDLLAAENAFVADALAHTDDLQAALFEEMKARIKETDLSVPFRKGGRWFYSRTEEGQQYPILCRTARPPPPTSSPACPSPARRCSSTSTRSPVTATTSRSAPTTSPRTRTCSSTPPTTTGPSATRCASATCAPAPTSRT